MQSFIEMNDEPPWAKNFRALVGHRFVSRTACRRIYAISTYDAKARGWQLRPPALCKGAPANRVELRTSHGERDGHLGDAPHMPAESRCR